MEERKAIMASMWIEEEMEFFILQIKRVLQAEILRSSRVIQILSDWYDTLGQRDPDPE